MAGRAPRKARKRQAGSPIVTQDAACKLPLEGIALRRPRCDGRKVHASARIWLVSADAWRHHGLWRDGGPGGGIAGTVRPGGAGRGGGGIRISLDPGGFDMLGGM